MMFLADYRYCINNSINLQEQDLKCFRNKFCQSPEPQQKSALHKTVRVKIRSRNPQCFVLISVPLFAFLLDDHAHKIGIWFDHGVPKPSITLGIFILRSQPVQPGGLKARQFRYFHKLHIRVSAQNPAPLAGTVKHIGFFAQPGGQQSFRLCIEFLPDAGNAKQCHTAGFQKGQDLLLEIACVSFAIASIRISISCLFGIAKITMLIYCQFNFIDDLCRVNFCFLFQKIQHFTTLLSLLDSHLRLFFFCTFHLARCKSVAEAFLRKHKVPENPLFPRVFGHLLASRYYSHSMVPTGLGVRSINTRLMPSTSAVMRAVILCRTA